MSFNRMTLALPTRSFEFKQLSFRREQFVERLSTENFSFSRKEVWEKSNARNLLGSEAR